MSNCLCLACDRANSITTRFCTQCGAKLQIQERYRALKVIGQGGFGKTFLAQDESKPSQPRCVIKQFAFETMNPNASQGTLDIAIRLFEQEAKRLDDLGKHPQIPELLSFTIHEGKQYLIQEFIDGETLEQELRRVGAFSEQQVRDVLVEVLQILEFVHSKSVIHRDISPDNIIRRRSDQKLVLVDFGAAKHATATLLAKTGTGIGKPSYGAPEQMLGKSVFQSDLFGLGVTCLHLLTNVEPFTLYDVLENEYQWRQFLNGKIVSDELGRLLDRLTSYKVKERPSSIMDALEELGISQTTEVPTFPISISKSVIPKQNNVVSSVNSQSNKDIDYHKLEQLLTNKEWHKADELTIYLMLKITNPDKKNWLDIEDWFDSEDEDEDIRLDYKDIESFPSEDLLKINNLWTYYSKSKFGFSIQKKLWLDCGGKIGEYDYDVWEKFASKVGWYHPQSHNWRYYDEFMNDTNNAHNALLASLPLLHNMGWNAVFARSLFSRKEL